MIMVLTMRCPKRLIQVNFDPMQEIGPKVWEGALSRMGALSQDYGKASQSLYLAIAKMAALPSL